jgi:recombination protein RecA
MFGSPEVTSGGRALKFYASVRLDIRRQQSIKKSVDGDNLNIGNQIKVKVVKNKVAPPHREIQTDFMFGNDGINPAGISRAKEIVVLSEKFGIIERSGAFYKDGETGEVIAQGIENVKTHFYNNPDTMNGYEQKVRDYMRSPIIDFSNTDVELSYDTDGLNENESLDDS